MNVSIQTLGCKVNFAEMADLADRLSRAGFAVAEEHDHPDVCVINSCTVTAQADRKVRTLVHGLRRRHPKAHIVLTGCHVDNPYPRASAVPSADVAFPNARKHEIFDYLIANFATVANSPSPSGGGQGGGEAGRYARSRFFLKVQDGCDHRCTYCIVWRTRGASRSEPDEAIIGRAERAVADGYGEVVLTGVDLGSYGRDRGAPFADLVTLLLDRIAPARLRLSSINANDFTPALVELAQHPRFCRHLHIPLQSGSDRVLKRMGRLYRHRDYLELVALLRQGVPDLAITTDVIVGFPDESEADFADTQAVARDAGLSGMHVFRYSPRAGTAAPRLGLPVDDPVSRDRSHRLQAQAEQQRRDYERKFVGRDLEVIWDRRFPGRIRGLSDNYITVLTADGGQALGALATVRPVAPCAEGLQA
jgi:threonylcarbamoyladenosine tRNA methylthiotransferase MtaB